MSITTATGEEVFSFERLKLIPQAVVYPTALTVKGVCILAAVISQQTLCLSCEGLDALSFYNG